MSDDEISIQFATYAEKKLDWPRRDSIIRRSVNAFVAIGHALLAIHMEFRRLNERNERFDTAMLEFFERLTEDPQPGPEGDGSLRSGQPAAAPDGQGGDKP